MSFGNGFVIGLALSCVFYVLVFIVTALDVFLVAAAMCLIAAVIVAGVVNG